MRALDLFAGAGGWDVACEALGVEVDGIEILPEAVATRAAAGLRTVASDVRDWSTEKLFGMRGVYDLLIASPPCATFSAAGRGAGRRALDVVLAGVARYAASGPADWPTAEELLVMTDDERTVLVLEPLRYALALRPEYLAWEQVPPVLPVWAACAEVLRSAGYSVATGKLSAERYGVPQTRNRAILVAALDGEARLPAPTNRPYKKGVAQHEGDPDLLPWVSMAEALGWGWTAAPSWTLMTARGRQTGNDVLRGSSWRAGKIRALKASQEWLAPPDTAHPGTTAMVGFPRRADGRGDVQIGAEAVFWKLRQSKQAKATVRGEDEPAPTVAFGNDMKSCRWVRVPDVSLRHSFGVSSENSWTPHLLSTDRPAPTVDTKSRSWLWELSEDEFWRLPVESTLYAPVMLRSTPGAVTSKGGTGVRVTVEEAAVLQSFPAEFPFQGVRTKRYLQVGNAIPPLLAYAVLAELVPQVLEIPRQRVESVLYA